MPRQAIRHEGDSAEAAFFNLVPGSRKSLAAKLGDAEVLVGEDWRLVEIKECHSDTINQVRAIKYIPLVIYAPEGELPWLVIPPNEVVRQIASKSRGQHTEIPFESANLSLKRISAIFRCNDENLAEHVISAILEGDRFDGVRAAMVELRSELVALSNKVKLQVAPLLTIRE